MSVLTFVNYFKTQSTGDRYQVYMVEVVSEVLEAGWLAELADQDVS